jgi:hypothetical protein
MVSMGLAGLSSLSRLDRLDMGRAAVVGVLVLGLWRSAAPDLERVIPLVHPKTQHHPKSMYDTRYA